MPPACSVCKVVPFDALALLDHLYALDFFLWCRRHFSLLGSDLSFSAACILFYISVICSAIYFIDCWAISSAYLLLSFICLICYWFCWCIMENIIVASFSSFSIPEAYYLMLLVRSNLDRLPAVERETFVRSWYSFPNYILTLVHVFSPVDLFSHLIRLSYVK